jgi:YVTN family beta-propeller protein
MQKFTWAILFATLSLTGASVHAADKEPGTITTTRLVVSDTSFSHPHDVALSPDGTRLYVADLDNNVVKVLDPNTLQTIGVIGNNDLDSPHDVSFDFQGRLMVADSGNDRIVVYQLSGNTGKKIATFGKGLTSPEGVTPGPDGLIYATDTGGGTVIAYRNGKPVVTAGENTTRRIDEFTRPHDIEARIDGKVFVVDSGNARIKILDKNLKLERILGGPGYDFNEPKYIAFDARGWLWVADEYNNKVKVFDGQYRLIHTIGTGTAGTGANQLRKPEGVDVKGDRAWIADTYNNRILLYRLKISP